MPMTQLKDYSTPHYSRGASVFVEALWICVQWLFVSSGFPGSAHRKLLLRMFGARIGRGVVIKPSVRVKFPWRLTIGDHSWIGEDVWIDNLAATRIGSNVCISQGAYLCTGSHDWSSGRFGLIAEPIAIEDGAWIAARATVGPGVVVGEGAVLCLGGTATKDLESWGIFAGVPATFVKRRTIKPPGQA